MVKADVTIAPRDPQDENVEAVWLFPDHLLAGVVGAPDYSVICGTHHIMVDDDAEGRLLRCTSLTVRECRLAGRFGSGSCSTVAGGVASGALVAMGLLVFGPRWLTEAVVDAPLALAAAPGVISLGLRFSAKRQRIQHELPLGLGAGGPLRLEVTRNPGDAPHRRRAPLPRTGVLGTTSHPHELPWCYAEARGLPRPPCGPFDRSCVHGSRGKHIG